MASWKHFGSIFGRLGRVLGCLGRVLGHLGSVLGRFSPRSGNPKNDSRWGFSISRRPRGGKDIFYFRFVFRGVLESVLLASWSDLVASWRRVGGILEASWDVLDATWTCFGVSWERLGASWKRLGAIIGAVGTFKKMILAGGFPLVAALGGD